MRAIWKPTYLIGFYFALLLALLLCVIPTPLLIRSGISLTARFVIDEEILETVMTLVLFGISFLLLIRIMNLLVANNRSPPAEPRFADGGYPPGSRALKGKKSFAYSHSEPD